MDKKGKKEKQEEKREKKFGYVHKMKIISCVIKIKAA